MLYIIKCNICCTIELYNNCCTFNIFVLTIITKSFGLINYGAIIILQNTIDNNRKLINELILLKILQ